MEETVIGPQRIAVALSGGVDSATAAALLIRQGYSVSGMTMRLWTGAGQAESPNDRFSGDDATTRARQVCESLGIPFRLVNQEEEFAAQVVDYFCDSYAAGRTPNPCLVCNRQIKFKSLLELALQQGAGRLATGHYARIREVDGRYDLLKGVDPAKDQSYVLYMLGQRELARVLFPLGTYTKRQVRSLARQLNLPTAEQPESQDACFVSDRDYRAFVAQRRPETQRPGPILDLYGHVVGQHQGIAFYTVGQRQGLGIAARQPLYVLEIDPKRDALIVGPKAALFRNELLAEQVSFVAGAPPERPVLITAKIRYKAPEVLATLCSQPGEKARVVFDVPQPAITPGQGIVFYQGDLVLGGGIIASAGSWEV